MREHLRQAEEQLQASRQQAFLLASELRDSASTRDHTMTELYRARLEADKLRASLADAQAECQRMESQLDRMRSTAQKEVVRFRLPYFISVSFIFYAVMGQVCGNYVANTLGWGNFHIIFSKCPIDFLLPQGVGTSGAEGGVSVVSEAEAELQREVEELKLRLHMAAEHYKEKYRECQRLRRQVAKLNTTESQGVSSL